VGTRGKRQSIAKLLALAPQSSGQRLREKDHLEGYVSQDGLSVNQSPGPKQGITGTLVALFLGL
jgi:hypothetical protein